MSSTIKGDETVTLYTTAAWPVAEEEWAVEVHGVIYELERSPLRTSVLRKLLGIKESSLQPAERERFRHRIGYFTADHEGGKSLSVQIGTATFALPKTGPNGHFHMTVRLPSARWRKSRKSIRLSMVMSEGDPRRFAGRVLLHADGPAPLVISDIDDTIKHTAVRDRVALKRNTFCLPFQPVAGMAAVYRRWAARDGADFHYVSSSPWQLYVPLEEFLREQGFPPGAWHLKYLRFKEPRTVRALFNRHLEHKLAAIETLLARWRRRPVVLVGDTGDQDPEIYGEIARRHSHRLHRIFLHDTTGDPREAERYRLALRDVPEEKWRLFRDARELPWRL